MYKTIASSFNFNSRYDLLKKSRIENIQGILQRKQASGMEILHIKSSKLRLPALIGSWAIEISTMQKAFFYYRKKSSKKGFYTPYSANAILSSKEGLLFLYQQICSIPLLPKLKSFFLFRSVRNFRFDIRSTFHSFRMEKELFYNLSSFFFNSLNKQNQVWFSLYKLLS